MTPGPAVCPEYATPREEYFDAARTFQHAFLNHPASPEFSRAVVTPKLEQGSRLAHGRNCLLCENFKTLGLR
jgi:hypothetical protein